MNDEIGPIGDPRRALDDEDIDRDIEVRIAACDLAEAWVERLGARTGFVVWRDVGGELELSDDAQERFDRASDIIERELRFFLDTRRYDAVSAMQGVVDALAKYATPDEVRALAERLAAS